HNVLVSSFVCNATPTTEIYTLSLHDALPILIKFAERPALGLIDQRGAIRREKGAFMQPVRSYIHHGKRGNLEKSGLRFSTKAFLDRKSTRLNSSHVKISYAVFCLKKKKKKQH